MKLLDKIMGEEVMKEIRKNNKMQQGSTFKEENKSMEEKNRKILKIISRIFGVFLILIAISNLNIVWFAFFGIPGILLFCLPEFFKKNSKRDNIKK